ncbi:MAG: ABC transporter ATP-binding protein [Acidimicrobiaceae bacterium]|nr:ABC transporter ATP-binding protein [Acidimicrobiaceae bacterium]
MRSDHKFDPVLAADRASRNPGDASGRSRPVLSTENLDAGYGGPLVLHGLTASIPSGETTAIVGANASGKSTLLRALARLLKPARGVVCLDGADIHSQSTRSVAVQLGLLPQSPRAPEGVVVGDLVRRGRYPHQRLFDQWSKADERAVVRALELTGLSDVGDRPIDELSGGQRQRAWIAMALAQDTPMMLLDEPTTFLDIAHQVEMLDLLARLNRSENRTIVMVLHDLNQACRYASHLIALADGRIEAVGHPSEVVTAEMIERVFGLRVSVISCPVSGTPLCVPHTHCY